MSSIESLVDSYETTGTWQSSIDLAQGLLDTETLSRYPKYRKLCDYYILEGLCYYVPDPVEQGRTDTVKNIWQGW